MPYSHNSLTPAQIISWLPKDATPEQQDSAVQAHIKPQEIHWSERPDTLHLPGHKAGKSVTDVNLPLYYKDNFFAEKPYFHPEIQAGRQGVAGDPIPYTVASDNFMTSVLLLCLIGTAISISVLSGFFVRRLKNFFYSVDIRKADIVETSNEVRMQLALALEACLLLSVMYVFYLKVDFADTFIIEQNEMIGLFTGVFASFFIIKTLLQLVVNWVFFDKEKNRQWITSLLFLLASLGLLLLPIVLIQSFFNLDIKISLIYLISIILLFELLSIYKLSRIFFIQKGAILGFFLYLCALEIMPVFLLWNVLTILSELLRINF